MQTIEDEILSAERSIQDLESLSDHLSSVIIQSAESFIAVAHSFFFFHILAYSILIFTKYLCTKISIKATFASCAEWDLSRSKTVILKTITTAAAEAKESCRLSMTILYNYTNLLPHLHRYQRRHTNSWRFSMKNLPKSVCFRI